MLGAGQAAGRALARAGGRGGRGLHTFGLVFVDLDALRERLPGEQGGAGQHPRLPRHLVLLHRDLDRVHGWHERRGLPEATRPRAPRRLQPSQGRGAGSAEPSSGGAPQLRLLPPLASVRLSPFARHSRTRVHSRPAAGPHTVPISAEPQSESEGGSAQARVRGPRSPRDHPALGALRPALHARVQPAAPHPSRYGERRTDRPPRVADPSGPQLRGQDPTPPPGNPSHEDHRAHWVPPPLPQ